MLTSAVVRIISGMEQRPAQSTGLKPVLGCFVCESLGCFVLSGARRSMIILAYDARL